MNCKKIPLLTLLILCLSAIPLNVALAQPLLVSSFPQANETVQRNPDQVRLTFDRLIDSNGLQLSVLDGTGNPVDNGDARVDPSNYYSATVSLPALPNGTFTVIYRVAALGGSTYLQGSYTFAVSTLPAELIIRAPEDGARLDPGPVGLSFDMRYADFSLYDTAINLYVDQQFVGQARELSYQIEGLAPGVHQIRAVISQYGAELGHTTREITVVIVAPDEELIGREEAASATPDSGLRLSPWQWGGLLTLLALLIVAGLLLGRLDTPPRGG